jgi:hypothetical protein
MNSRESLTANLAAVAVGVTAVGMVLFGVFLPTVSLASGTLAGAAAVAVVMIGAVSIAAAIVAGFAAWALATGRRVGTLVGLGIGLVLLLTVAVAALSGGWHPALWAAVGLGTIEVAATMTLLTSRLSDEHNQR